MVSSAFTDELLQIKLAQQLPVGKMVSKILGRGDPSVEAKGLRRVGQLLTGSRQKALKAQYLGRSSQLSRRMSKVVPSKEITPPQHWQQLGDMAKAELGERQAVQKARRFTAGAASVPAVGLTAGAAEGSQQ